MGKRFQKVNKKHNNDLDYDGHHDYRQRVRDQRNKMTKVIDKALKSKRYEMLLDVK